MRMLMLQLQQGFSIGTTAAVSHALEVLHLGSILEPNVNALDRDAEVVHDLPLQRLQIALRRLVLRA